MLSMISESALRIFFSPELTSMNNDNLTQSTDRGFLTTEQSNPLSKSLDLLSTQNLVNLFSEEDKAPQKAVEKSIESIANSIDLITLRLKNGGRLFYLGAGTSGRLGVLDAAECPPTFCTPPDLIQGIIAGGIPSLLNSSEHLEDIEEEGINDLKSKEFSSQDCLIGITAGGTTPYVKAGLLYAKGLNALSIAISCVPTEQAYLPCDIDIRLITGPELLTGSTRLKAGTATKMALNIISTSVMIKLGKVLGNKMIDVSASNSKLIDRSIRILKDVADIDRETGMKLLSENKFSVKLSLLVHLLGLDYNKALTILEENNNNVRKALLSKGYQLKDS